MARFYIIDANDHVVLGFTKTAAAAKRATKDSRSLAYVSSAEGLAGLAAEALTGIRNSVVKGRAAAVKTVERNAASVAEKVFAALEEDDQLLEYGKKPKPAKSKKDSEPVGPGRGRAPAFSDEASIAIATEGQVNPCREGSAVYDRFELYRKSKTVGDFIAKGGRRGDLRWHVARGEVAVTEPNA